MHSKISINEGGAPRGALARRMRSPLRENHWIEWSRTRLPPQDREALSTALTPEQKAHLLEHDYVWVKGVGVLWNPPQGDPLRRARFTHGTHFQTRRGEFYIDSEGSACQLADLRIDPPTSTTRPPSLPGNGERSATSTLRPLVSTPGSAGGAGGAQNANTT